METDQKQGKVVRYAEWIIEKRWWVIGLFAVAFLAAAAGLGRVRFSGNYRVYFDHKNPDLMAFDALQNMYSKEDGVFMVLAPKSGDMFTREGLSAMEWLTREAWKLPYANRVNSLTNFQNTSANGDDLVVADLVEDAASLSDADLKRAREIALAEPLLAGRMVARDGHAGVVYASCIFPDKDELKEGPEAAMAAKDLVRRFRERYPDVPLHASGSVLFNFAYMDYAQKDMKTLVPAMYGVILLIVFLILRSLTGLAVTVLAIGMSILATMGLTGWLGIILSPSSVGAPTIVMTVALADCIHLLTSMLHAMRHGMGKREAIIESLRLNLGTLALTAVNTVVGFATLNASDSPPFRDLGNITAMGVTVAFCYTSVLLPALLAVLPVRAKPAADAREIALDRLTDFVVRRRRTLLWTVSLGCLALGLAVFRNSFYDEFGRNFSLRTEIRQNHDAVVKHIQNDNWFDYSISAGQSGGISDPAYLRKLEEFVQWYRRQPDVVYVEAVTDIVKRLNKNMHGDDQAYYRIPEERDLIAQYLLLYELSLPFGLDINDRINVDKSASRVTVSVNIPDTARIVELDRRAQAWLRENAPEHMQSKATGVIIMFARLSLRNLKSMIGGDLGGILIIALVMMIAVRSVKFGLVSLVPNLIPAGLAFGVWGLLSGRLGMDAAPVTGITLGILVDDTTHNISKYLYARRSMGLSPAEAIRYTFATVGTATLAITGVLMAGFLVLAFSAFKFNSTMGLMSALIIGVGGVLEFFLLPPLLLKLEEKEHEKATNSDDDAVELDAGPVSA